MARRRWRNVDAENEHVGVVDFGRDALNFHARVVDEGAIDGSKRDVVMDEEPDAASTTPVAVFVDEVVTGDVREARASMEFSFLKADDGDAMFVEKFSEFVDFVGDSVGVPVREDRERRSESGGRPRIGVHPTDEKEKNENDEND